MPYRVAGTFVQDGVPRIVLVRGERLISVGEGDKFDGGYRVQRVAKDEITLVYEPLGTSERLAVAAPAPSPSTAPAAAGASRAPTAR